MINLVVTKFFKDFKANLELYGILSDVRFSSDITLISEYTKSFRIRNLMQDYKLITDQDAKNLIDLGNYALCLYNRSSIKKSDIANNLKINAGILPSGIDPNIAGADVLQAQKILEPYDIEIRSVIHGSISIQVKMLSSNSNCLESLEFLLLDNYIKKNPTFGVKVKFSENMEPLEFDYNTNFSDIDEFGLIDPKVYGDMQQISFSFDISGMFLSMFKRNEKSMSSVSFLLEVM